MEVAGLLLALKAEMTKATRDLSDNLLTTPLHKALDTAEGRRFGRWPTARVAGACQESCCGACVKGWSSMASDLRIDRGDGLGVSTSHRTKTKTEGPVFFDGFFKMLSIRLDL